MQIFFHKKNLCETDLNLQCENAETKVRIYIVSRGELSHFPLFSSKSQLYTTLAALIERETVSLFPF